jgi:hypothetical protein
MSSPFVSSLILCSLVGLGLLGAACGSAPPAELDGKSGQAQTATPVDPAFTPCAFDSDCVAVPQAGCCSNGWLAAVNTDLVNAYDCANACSEPAICAQYVVVDTRVALCDNASLACEMVLPASIRCGGDGVNPHSCPAGYSCVLGPNDTTVGTCTKGAPAASDDAGAPASDDAGTTGTTATSP